MARLLAARQGDPVRIEGVTNPDDPDRDLYEQGALLPGPHATLAGPTFEEWLDDESAPGLSPLAVYVRRKDENPLRRRTT